MHYDKRDRGDMAVLYLLRTDTFIATFRGKAQCGTELSEQWRLSHRDEHTP